MVTVMKASFVLLIAITLARATPAVNKSDAVVETTELPEPILIESSVYYVAKIDNQEARTSRKNISVANVKGDAARIKNHKRKNSTLNEAIQVASLQGLNAMIDLYERKEPEILRKGEFLDFNHPAVKLSLFSAPMTNETDAEVKGAYASLYAAKKLQESLNLDFSGLGRQASKKKISLKRTSLEGLCPPREAPQCLPATKRYRTHDGTCNNLRRPRWGSAHLPFHRFLAPDYADGLETVRGSATGGPLPSARFVSLVVHGHRDDEAPITMLLANWGQLIDHDVTATLQPRSINGSIPSCCRSEDPHPSCLPIKVPRDDPFLASLGVRCLEFLRSAPAQRRDCFLSWREQTNQVTSYIDASPVYSSNPRTADNSRINRDGLLLFGRGPPREDPCLRGGFGHQCIRAGDTRAGEQPSLLALHTVFVAEHNRITLELTDLNPHWSDEKLYQETRRIIGAMFQHITYREFLPLVLGKEVCRLFDLELEQSGFYQGYDSKVNPTIANAFSAAAFRFGHSLVQGSIMRSDMNYRFLTNNVTLHDETSHGDIGGTGSLHRIIRGMATQRTLKRDEFMSAELTNHLFQSNPFPFGMDLAAINIQRGRDHGLPSYVDWRQPCGLSAINSWEDLEVIAGPQSAKRMKNAYDNIEDIDLFVGGLSERPVVGGLVGPTFACIIAQQFSNLRKGDRFWYENPGFESSFTPAQLFSIRQVTLSQILCRSLGSTNFIQPHSFLPPEFVGNERVRCNQGNLAPMSLSAWVERDPFNKEGDFPTLNLVKPNDEIFISVGQNTFENPQKTSERPFIPNINFPSDKPVTSRPNPSTTTKTNPTVDNKLDFSQLTTTKPKRKRTTATTRRPTPTVSNKLDFEELSTSRKPETTTRPDSPFSKLGKDSKKSTSKRSTNQKRKKPKNPTESRSDDLTDSDLTKTDLTIFKKFFANSDNATKYLDNKPIASRLDNIEDIKLDSRSNDPEARFDVYLTTKNYENDFDYDERPNRPLYDYSRPGSYYPLYPSQTTTPKRPVVYQNNRPTYQDSLFNNNKRQPSRPTDSPISNKIQSTPFSYDTYKAPQGSISSLSPQIDYENMAIPLYVSPNRVSSKPSYQNSYRPTYATTRKMELSTFLFIETTRRPPLPLNIYDLRQTTQRPKLDADIQISFSTPSNSIFISPSSLSDSHDSINLSYLFSSSNTNKVSIKKPTHENPKPFSDYQPLSVFSHDTFDAPQDDFDGYLRPETSFYVPLKNKFKPTYNDYSKYNLKPETSTPNSVRFVYLENVLHKYYQGKSGDDGDKQGLYDRGQTNRYAEIYDKHLNDKNSDDFISMTRTMTDDKTDHKKETDDSLDIDGTDIESDENYDNYDDETLQLDGRSKNGQQNLFLVPFKVLTKIDRPDNWVNRETTDEDLKSRLPEVPSLRQDENLAQEVPKPLLGNKALKG